MTTPTAAYDAAIAYAAERGTTDGRNAAEWYVQDAFGGRVTRGADDSARAILQGIEDGDPAVLDTLPSPDLSGQWADSLTGPRLVEDAIDAAIGAPVSHVGHVAADDRCEYSDWFTDVCDAYESAYSDAVSAEVERAARLVVA